MWNNILSLKNILAFWSHLVFLSLICSLESTFFNSNSFLIEIDLWLIPLVFLFLHRNILSNIIYCLAASFVISSFTGIPNYQLILSLTLTMLSVFLFKNRSFTQGNSYFSVCVFISVLTFYFMLFFWSNIFDDTPISYTGAVAWFISAMITPAFAFLFKPFQVFIDRVFRVTYPFGFEV